MFFCFSDCLYQLFYAFYTFCAFYIFDIYSTPRSKNNYFTFTISILVFGHVTHKNGVNLERNIVFRKVPSVRGQKRLPLVGLTETVTATAVVAQDREQWETHH